MPILKTVTQKFHAHSSSVTISFHYKHQSIYNLHCSLRFQTHLKLGVDGDSLRALLVKLNITTSRQRRIGPKMAPSQPSQYIPPAILKPVKYACPPLKKQKRKPNLRIGNAVPFFWSNLPFHICVDGWIDETCWKQNVNQKQNYAECKAILN